MTAAATFETLLEIDARLYSKGILPLTPWWSSQLKRWYAHPTARTLVAEVGRGGAKSHTMGKVLLNELVCGEWDVPPGEVHYAIVVSENLDEAAGRLTFIDAGLTALGVKHSCVGDTITIARKRIGARIRPARIGGVSGFRAFFTGADECAKWQVEGINPAPEILASMRAMRATHPRAREMVISSPMGKVGAHYAMMRTGDTASQLACNAPTWIANPSVTEEQTRELEPDPRLHRREYGAIPSEGGAVIDVDALRKCVRPLDPAAKLHPPTTVLDTSGGKKDRFVWFQAAWTDAGRLRVWNMRSLSGAVAERYTTEEVGAMIAADAHHAGARLVIGDQYGAWAWSNEVGKHGLPFRELAWSAPTKSKAVVRLSELVRDGLVEIEPGDEADGLVFEAVRFEEKVLPSGAFGFSARRGHDDRVMALLLAARADAESVLAGTALREAQREAWGRIWRDNAAILDHGTVDDVPAKVAEVSARIERQAAHGFSEQQLARAGFERDAMRIAGQRRGRPVAQLALTNTGAVRVLVPTAGKKTAY